MSSTFERLWGGCMFFWAISSAGKADVTAQWNSNSDDNRALPSALSFTLPKKFPLWNTTLASPRRRKRPSDKHFRKITNFFFLDVRWKSTFKRYSSTASKNMLASSRWISVTLCFFPSTEWVPIQRQTHLMMAKDQEIRHLLQCRPPDY